MRDSRVWDEWIGPEIHFQYSVWIFPPATSTPTVLTLSNEQKSSSTLPFSSLNYQRQINADSRLSQWWIFIQKGSLGKFLYVSFISWKWKRGENAGKGKFLVSLPKQFLDIKFNKSEILAYTNISLLQAAANSRTDNKFIESICFNVYRLSPEK